MWSTPGGTEVLRDPEGEVKPGTTTENQPTSSGSPKKVSWGGTTTVFVYPPDPLPLPPGRDGYLAKVAAQQLPQTPKSNGFVSMLKTFFGKFRKLKFGRRFQRTVDTEA